MISGEEKASPEGVRETEQGTARALSAKVARGSLSSIIRKVAVVPLSLLLVPFTLYKIGVTEFGIWAILTTVINLVWLVDPGLAPAVTKYVAEHQGDTPELQRIVDAAIALCIVLAIVTSGLIWAFSGGIIHELFRGPAAPSEAQIRTYWPLVMLCIAAFLMTNPFLSVINGCQRMDLTNLVVFVGEIFSAAATVVLLLLGWGIRGLLVVQLLTSLMILLGGIWVVHRLLPGVIPNPLRCRLATVRKVVGFSVPLYAGYVMTTMQGQLEKLYLARFLGIVPVGWFSIASQGATKVKRVPDLLMGPVLAAASELDAGRETEKLEELHFRAHKYLGMVALPAAAFAVVDAKQLMAIWVGQRLELIGLAFAILVIGNLFSQIGAPTYFVVVGRGILKPTVYACLVAAVLNVVLSFLFIRQWGFAGAALGTAIPMFLSTAVLFAMCREQFVESLLRTLTRAYMKPLLCSLAAAGASLGVRLYITGMWRRVMAEGLVFAAVYLIGLATTGFFDSFDRKTAAAHLPFLRYRAGSVQ